MQLRHRARAALRCFCLTSLTCILFTLVVHVVPAALRTYLRFRDVTDFTANQWLPDNQPHAVRSGEMGNLGNLFTDAVFNYGLGSKTTYWDAVIRQLNALCNAAQQVPPAAKPGAGEQGELVPLGAIQHADELHTPMRVSRYHDWTDDERSSYADNFGFAVMTCPDDYPTTHFIRDQQLLAQALTPLSKHSYWSGPDAVRKDDVTGIAFARMLGLDRVDYHLAPYIGVQLAYAADAENGATAFFPAGNVFRKQGEAVPDPCTVPDATSSLPQQAARHGDNKQPTASINTTSSYDPRTRPWFPASTNESKNRRELDARAAGVGLSWQYTDYGKWASDVRTAWKTCSAPDPNDPSKIRQLVVALDLVMYPGRGPVNSSLLAAMESGLRFDLAATFTRSLRTLCWLALPCMAVSLLLLLGLSPHIAGYLAIGRIARFKDRSKYRAHQYYFVRRGDPMYFDPDRQRMLTHMQKRHKSTRDEMQAKWKSLLAGLASFELARSVHRERIDDKQLTSTRPVGPSHPGERCMEYWTLEQQAIEERVCRTCRQAVPNIAESELQAGFEVTHRDHAKIDVELVRDFGGTEPDSMRYDLQIESFLAQTAISEQSEILIDPQRSESHRALQVPVSVGTLVDEVGEIARGRLSFPNVLDVGAQLYVSRDVRAVCGVYYLTRLFESNCTSLLTTGQYVERILLVDSVQEILDLNKSWKEELRQVLQAKGKELCYALKSDLPEALRHHWDFAFLRTERLVLVTDTFRFEFDKNAPRLAAHLSWRRADVHFFEMLFRHIAGKKRDLRALLATPTADPEEGESS